MNKKNIFKLLLINIALLIILSGCDIFSQTDSEYATVSIGVPTTRALSDDIASYTLTVTAEDIEDKTITFTNDSTTLDIKTGTDRTFTLVGYDADGNTLFEGETTTDLESGDNNVEIEITFVGYSYYKLIVTDGVDGPAIDDIFYVSIINDIISLLYYSSEYMEWSEFYRGEEFTKIVGDSSITFNVPNSTLDQISIVLDSIESNGSFTYYYHQDTESSANFYGSFTAYTGESPLNDIIEFNIEEVESTSYVSFDGLDISIEDYFEDKTALTPTITIPLGATISPASGVAQDFTDPVEYTVTAQDGTTAVYTVTISDPV